MVDRLAILVTVLAGAHPLAVAHTAVCGEVARWDGRGVPPPALARAAYTEQRLERTLWGKPALLATTVRGLPRPVAERVRDDVSSHDELARLTPPQPFSAFHAGRAAPAEVLLAAYLRGQRRFGVPWQVLAAVNLIESAFGRVRNESVSGAQGPMQFLPATWRAYGLGGDVHDPADAILGAANYLHANGAPSDLRRALYHYNPSSAYVDALLRYAHELGRDRCGFGSYFARQVLVRTPQGVRRLTGPALR